MNNIKKTFFIIFSKTLSNAKKFSKFNKIEKFYYLKKKSNSDNLLEFNSIYKNQIKLLNSKLSTIKNQYICFIEFNSDNPVKIKFDKFDFHKRKLTFMHFKFNDYPIYTNVDLSNKPIGKNLYVFGKKKNMRKFFNQEVISLENITIIPSFLFFKKISVSKLLLITYLRNAFYPKFNFQDLIANIDKLNFKQIISFKKLNNHLISN